MLNNLTLGESVKQIGVNFKTMFRLRYCFLASAATVNLSALSSIIDVDKTFFSESFKWKY
ncbi:MAG: hypothetical protein ACTS8H_03125 [Arsenophonus sp. NC-PE1-MAG3]